MYLHFVVLTVIVTSVGATQFYGKPNTSKPDGEMVCSSQTGAIITGGGGFSLVQPRVT